VGKLIEISSGNLEIDRNLKKINEFERQKYKNEKEIQEKTQDLKKMTFFFTLIGVFFLPFFLSYIAYGLWKSCTIAQQLALYLSIVCAMAIAFWLSRNIYKFIFYGLE
jgi:ABC-type phosphate/phosphonate transport system permease subunit